MEKGLKEREWPVAELETFKSKKVVKIWQIFKHAWNIGKYLNCPASENWDLTTILGFNNFQKIYTIIENWKIKRMSKILVTWQGVRRGIPCCYGSYDKIGHFTNMPINSDSSKSQRRVWMKEILLNPSDPRQEPLIDPQKISKKNPQKSLRNNFYDLIFLVN